MYTRIMLASWAQAFARNDAVAQSEWSRRLGVSPDSNAGFLEGEDLRNLASLQGHDREGWDYSYLRRPKTEANSAGMPPMRPSRTETTTTQSRQTM